VCMPTRTPPVHTTAPTSAYPGHYPRPWLLGRSPFWTGLPPAPFSRPRPVPPEAGLGFRGPAWAWAGPRGAGRPPGPHRGAYHGRGSPWPRDHVLLDPASQPALAGRF